MFNKIKAANGAGYRAGRSEPTQIFVTQPDGSELSFLLPKRCPFTRKQLLRFLAWQEGHREGTMQRLNRSWVHG